MHEMITIEMNNIVERLPEYFKDLNVTIKDDSYLFEILKIDWRYMEDTLTEIISILCTNDNLINYVDSDGTNILMAYCKYTDGLEFYNTKEDIKNIITNFNQSINDCDKYGNTALKLAYENMKNSNKRSTISIYNSLLNYNPDKLIIEKDIY